VDKHQHDDSGAHKRIPALVLDPAQVARMEQARLQQEDSANGRTDPDEGAPKSGANVGGYNAFWLDRGMKVGVVNGQARSSWITEPEDGKMPFSDAGKRIASSSGQRNEDGPEGMNPADRRLIGSRGSGGPPMLKTSTTIPHQIVQTPDDVTIDVEMMHDARVIRLNQTHKPAAVGQWLWRQHRPLGGRHAGGRRRGIGTVGTATMNRFTCLNRQSSPNASRGRAPTS